MERQEILNQISEAFGSVPGYCTEMPDAVLEQFWTTNVWFSSDTTLSARDKALVAFGAATGVTCEY